jgi:hypothetical protein
MSDVEIGASEVGGEARKYLVQIFEGIVNLHMQIRQNYGIFGQEFKKFKILLKIPYFRPIFEEVQTWAWGVWGYIPPPKDLHTSGQNWLGGMAIFST